MLLDKAKSSLAHTSALTYLPILFFAAPGWCASPTGPAGYPLPGVHANFVLQPIALLQSEPSSKLNVTGQWTDSYGFIFNLKQAAGIVSGNVVISGCPENTWGVTGSVSGDANFTLTATDPDGGDDTCDASFQYVMTLSSAGNASGTWTSSAGGAGSVSMQLTSALAIIKPGASDLDDLSDEDFTGAKVAYEANEVGDKTSLSWTIGLSYTSSGGVGPFTNTDSFTGEIGQTKNFINKSEGGMATANVSDAAGNAAAPVVFYIDGNSTGIPNSEITSQLTTLYANDHAGLTAYTSDLLCHVAVQESSYAQFSSAVALYGVSGLWPKENPPISVNGVIQTPSGTFIGLLQPPNSMTTAFDWKKNAISGRDTLNSKLKAVLSYVAAEQKTNPNLPSLPGDEVEDSALVSYGGFANRNPNTCKIIHGALRYYVPMNGTSWALNPAVNCISAQGNSAAQYVQGIRQNHIPQ